MAFDEEEFTLIFEEVYPNLCRFLESLLKDHAKAQDIAQESFVRLFRLEKPALQKSEARFWLFRVARNLALNEMRNTSKRSGFFQRVAEALYKPRPDQARDLERAEAEKMTAEMLEFLPEDQRAALLLREREEMSYREIANVLNISENKVKTDIFRARNAVRKNFRFEDLAP